MTRLLGSRGSLWLFFLASLTGLPLPGYAEKKTKFESSILVPTHRFEADGFCGTLTGSVGAGDFFKGLQRIETQPSVAFRKKSKIVREFPEEIDFALTGSIGSCPLSLPNSQTAESLNDFVKRLSVVAEWIDGDASRNRSRSFGDQDSADNAVVCGIRNAYMGTPHPGSVQGRRYHERVGRFAAIRKRSQSDEFHIFSMTLRREDNPTAARWSEHQ